MTPSNGVYGEVGIELTDLSRLGNKALISLFHIFALELHCLFQRLGARGLLHRRRVFQATSAAIA
jgi:hypothetical protein